MFGVDAQDVPHLRAERKDFKDYDPRWTQALQMVRRVAQGRGVSAALLSHRLAATHGTPHLNCAHRSRMACLATPTTLMTWWPLSTT